MLAHLKMFSKCKIAHSVKDYTQSTFFHVSCEKFYTWLKTLKQPAVVMVVTNMRCVQKYLPILTQTNICKKKNNTFCHNSHITLLNSSLFQDTRQISYAVYSPLLQEGQKVFYWSVCAGSGPANISHNSFLAGYSSLESFRVGSFIQSFFCVFVFRWFNFQQISLAFFL